MKQAAIDPGSRQGIARWVVHEVTDPSERPVKVALIFRSENLPPPGVEGGAAVATKVLYEEELTSPE